MNLIIIGALPPPRGGVTTHVERLIPHLEASGIKYVVWDYSRKLKKDKRVISLCREPLKLIISLLKTKGVKVSHCLISSVSFIRLIFCLFLKLIRIRLVVTFVGSPSEMVGDNSLKLFYILSIARFSSHVIAVNRDFKDILISRGIGENKISIIPAFIPSRDNDLIERPIPQNMIDFCMNSKPLILTYGYGPLFHSNEDLYGLDIIVQVARKLRKDMPQAGIVVVISDITNDKYFKKLKADIQKQGLNSSFCFVIGNQFSFISFLQYADIFIRATNTDGDALTLRESLYYGVPSVASDVCYRPEGTILFRNRNVSDLYKVVREVLCNGSDIRHVSQDQKANNAELFIDVFKQVAGMRN